MIDHVPSPDHPPDDVDAQASGCLPTVEPPTPRFLLQLFVIPLTIVIIIVFVWLAFSWLAHVGNSPHTLVRRLERQNAASWQSALTLAELLQNSQYENLKRDPDMADELATLLTAQLDAAKTDTNSLRLRMFLCRALGEFLVPDVLPVLVRAAQEERSPEELDVRRAAIEAIAVYASNNESGSAQPESALRGALLSASRQPLQNDDWDEQRAELRSTAAFALGVLGGEEALARLAFMLGDSHANTRYNAATALSRHGDVRAVPVLLEMLAPDNPEATRGEQHESGEQWKRLLVMENGIRAARQLATNHPQTDLQPLIPALQHIQQSELARFTPSARRGLKIRAAAAILDLQLPTRAQQSE